MHADGFYWVILKGNGAWGVVSKFLGAFFYVGREISQSEIETWGTRINPPAFPIHKSPGIDRDSNQSGILANPDGPLRAKGVG